MQLNVKEKTQMKLTLKNIKELKQNSNSPLYKRVCNYVISEWSNYDDKSGIFKDVCQAARVGKDFPKWLNEFLTVVTAFLSSGDATI